MPTTVIGSTTVQIPTFTSPDRVFVTPSKTSLKYGETADIYFVSNWNSTNILKNFQISGGTLSTTAGSSPQQVGSYRDAGGTVAIIYRSTYTPLADYNGGGSLTVPIGGWESTVYRDVVRVYYDFATQRSVTVYGSYTSNDNTATATFSINTVRPTVSISSQSGSTLASGSNAALTFSLSGDSTDFTIDDISVSGGSLSGFTGSGRQYSATFTPAVNLSGQSGTATISVRDQVFTDAASGNPNKNSSLSFSIDPFTATYALTALQGSVNEGSTATFSLNTNLPSGTSVAYTLAGVTAADLAGGSLSGSVTVGGSGQATISVTLLNDLLTEGAETLTVTAGTVNTSTTVNDTSRAAATYALAALNSSVDEGSTASFTLSTTNLASGTAVPYTLSGVTAADLVGGSLSGFATVGANGQATISVGLVNDQLTEGSETLTVTTEGTSSSVTINDTSRSVAAYALVASSSSVNEGGNASFVLSTSNVAAGTSVPYTLSGVTAADVVGGSLTGSVTIGVNGQATISVGLVNDQLTEGAETLTVTAGNATATQTVNDTSRSSATYSLAAMSPSVDEGSVASFALSTTNLASGTAVPYTLSGVTAADVVGGSLTGSVTVGANGQATISVSLVNDSLTEGLETLTVTAGNTTASQTVNDTSRSSATYSLAAMNTWVDEGSMASFALSTTNLASGTTVPYTLSGVTAEDVVGGSLTGSVTVGANGQATISVSLVNDQLTEGEETLTVTAGNATARQTVNDTSRSSATYSLAAMSPSVDEGLTATFILSTTNIAIGTTAPYTISGVTAADVVGGSLTGTLLVVGNGQAIIPISLLNDLLTEGPETLTVTVGNVSASTVVNDTSRSAATYSLTSLASSVDEGNTANFLLNTTNIPAGTSIAYSLSGINGADIVGGALDGSVIAGANGQTNILVALINDFLTEGTETLTITAGNVSASIQVNDTSKSTALPVSSGLVIEWNRSSSLDKVVGGQGIDKLQIPAKRSDFSYSKDQGFVDRTTGKSVALQSVERIQFADSSLAVDLDGNAGKAVMALGAVFGRDAVKNKELVGIALSVYDKNLMSDSQIARIALEAALGKSPSNESVVDLLYKNLVGVYPDQIAKTFYVGMINTGIYTQESITLMAMGLDLNKGNIDIVGLSKSGVEFTPSLF